MKQITREALLGYIDWRLRTISEAIKSNDKYPSLTWIRTTLRYSLAKRYKKPILAAYIIGSEAKGTAKSDSDLDIALVIKPIRGKTSIKFTEDFQDAYATYNVKQPRWNGRVVDFQFFYPEDEELKSYSKIEITFQE